jgi:hypothetical protein
METVRWLHQIFGGRLYPLFVGITFLGSSAFLWPVIALWYWLVDPRFARRLGVVLGLSVVLNQLIKTAVGSPRPYDLESGLASELARKTGGGHGFPSGHTQNTAAFWTSLALRFNRRWLWALAVLMIALVALSRMALGVHMPVDVAGGAAFGALAAWVGSRMPMRELAARRAVVAPAIALAGLAVSYLGGIEPAALALLAAFLLARPAFVPPRASRLRLAMAAGGIACLALGFLLVAWLPERLFPGWAGSPAGAYLSSLFLAGIALEGWPRLWLRLRPQAGRVTEGADVRSSPAEV